MNIWIVAFLALVPAVIFGAAYLASSRLPPTYPVQGPADTQHRPATAASQIPGSGTGSTATATQESILPTLMGNNVISGQVADKQDAWLQVSLLNQRSEERMSDSACRSGGFLLGNQFDFAGSFTSEQLDKPEVSAAMVKFFADASIARDVIAILKREVSQKTHESLDWACRLGKKTYLVMGGKYVGRIFRATSASRPEIRWYGPVEGFNLDSFMINDALLDDGQVVVGFRFGDGGVFMWNYFALNEETGSAELIEYCRLEPVRNTLLQYTCAKLYKPGQG